MNGSQLIKSKEDHIIETLPLRDQLADIIRRMVLKGELHPGQQISERQLSFRFETSTTPVKEALRVLQSEGLVYSKPRVGTFVSEVSQEHIYKIVAMRGALEGVAAGFAAQNCTQEEIAQMTEILDQVQTVLDEAGELDREKVSGLNAQFHQILRVACRSDYLVNLICNMNSIDRTIRALSFELLNAPHEANVAYNEHRSILVAVARHNSELAESLMNFHIRRVAKEVTQFA